MSHKKMDDLFKHSFSGYSPDVPPHIWDNIAAGRKKRRPAGFWLNRKAALLLFIAALFLAGGAGYFIIAKKEDRQHNSLEKNSSGQEKGNTAPAAVLPAAEKSSKDDTATAGNTAIVKKDNATQPTRHNTATASGIKEPLVNSSSDNAGTASENAITASGEQNVDGKNDGPYKSGGKKAKGTYKINVGANEPVTVLADGEDDPAGAGSESEPTLRYADDTKHLPLLLAQSNLTKPAIEPFIPAVKLSEECPGAPGNKYYIEAYISPDYAIKKYNDTGRSTLVERRKESLRFHSAFSAGMRYTRVFNNGMSMRTGINFSQINEKFSYAKDNVVQIVYVINNQGDTTDSYYVRGTRYKNSYNHFRTVDVPLLVGYEMGNDRLRANINAGAVVNIYSWQQGETIDNNGDPVTITTGKADNPYQYKTNVGIGFTAGASFYYKLNHRFYAMAEPYFRYNFSPMNKEVLSIQERFTTIGLRLGVRMDIK